MNYLSTYLFGFVITAIERLLILGSNPKGFLVSSLLGLGGNMLARADREASDPPRTV